jgi:hypothetical protein
MFSILSKKKFVCEFERTDPGLDKKLRGSPAHPALP